jgi:hypothetical protein
MLSGLQLLTMGILSRLLIHLGRRARERPRSPWTRSG